MAEIVTPEQGLIYKDDKLRDYSDKASFDSNEKKGIDDAEVVREVEAFEERLQNDEAADEEYLIQDAADVALKVSGQSRYYLSDFAHRITLRQVLSTHDDPDLPSLTFRTFFLGLGFSAFGA